MSERKVRRLLRTAAKDNYSSQQLTNELSLSASVRTIQRVLAGVELASLYEDGLHLAALCEGQGGKGGVGLGSNLQY
ncbi:Hypothetical protein PHPALM_14542 [Phytophthora palmivora]|uniref:Uncharacterized protein n=1 Tax=Phytophthora palmivora TaxID=4796 RepID=A0A2P4XUF7_9STRA|nr:Hypothetical protein PHPALM_14542 [Phytophthora palmivora]